MATVTVSRSGDRLIAVKQVSAAQIRSIEREAATLRRLDHPGVVRFVDLVETPDGGRTLHTDFVSSDTWATRPITDPAERAAGVAALAEVVADLHDAGVAHCQVDPSHVLHGEDTRPVLCGFRLATEATVENRRNDLVALADLCHDPALEPGSLVGKLSALADAARAGRLDIRELARRLKMVPDRHPAAGEPARAGRDQQDRPRRERSRRKFLMAAAVLGVSATVLAAGVWSRGGQATSAPATVVHPGAPPVVPAGIKAGETAPATDTAGSPITAAVGEETDTAASADPAAAQALTPPGTFALAGGHPTATAADRTSSLLNPAAVAGATPTAPADAPSPMIPGGLGTAAAGPGLAGAPAGSAINSGANGLLLPPTPSAVSREPRDRLARHEPGAVLEHGGRLYGVGTPGDFVQTGDWDCDGEPTPAILRPSTGDVVLFDAWPEPNRSIAMPVRWKVENATGAEVVAHGPCDLLRVYTPAGSRLFDPMADR